MNDASDPAWRKEELVCPDDLWAEDWRLANSLAVRIDWLNSAIERQTRSLLGDSFGLTAIEWRCLATLCVHGAKTGSDLSQMCSENPSQISRALRSLRDKGLVKWPAGSRKRGFGAVYPSEEGESMFRKVKPIMQARNIWFLGGLEESEWRELYRLVSHLRKRIANAPDFDELKNGADYRRLTGNQ